MNLLFIAKGRIQRLTFWEGLVAWVLINTLCLMVAISLWALPVDAWLETYFSDTDHVWYYGLVMLGFFSYWIFSTWVLLAICAKRWHDLNLPGWLAVINVLPVLICGDTFLTFIGSVTRQMSRRLAVDSKTSLFDLLDSVKGIYLEADPGYTHLMLSMAVILAVFIYLGFARGDTRANEYGKTAA